jgi:hypothetical protein
VDTLDEANAARNPSKRNRAARDISLETTKQNST